MIGHRSEPASPERLTVERDRAARRLAARVWRELEGAGVVPTPRNFELWYTHLSGADPKLSWRLEALLNKDAALTDAVLDSLHADCATPEFDLDAITDKAEAIGREAQAVVDQVTGNGAELRRYGDTLAHYAVQLGERRTVDGLVQAVATLTAETARAGERNRALEQQLSAAAARIARLKDTLAEVKREATTDALTSLCNRKAFDARLRKALSVAKSDGTAVSVLLIDVDHFKRVNDTYGHHAGDLVLRLIGRLLCDNVKGRDTAARYGGEEFAIILAGADGNAGAIVAEQIRAALDSKRLVNKASGEDMGAITLSVGVAQFRPGEAASSLVSRADAALYRAKRNGRNQVCTEDALGVQSHG